ncbi:MAG TPA: hypothetical protein VER58_04450 [Thermoanaerobaculia bacterium]|nr:hypothetical protein [Thermoanaerobaculia bacterium]
MFAAAVLIAATTLSQRLTAEAEELLKIERKIAASHGLDSVMYEDVLTLLDDAIDADPHNLHARARAGEVLLLKSNLGDGTFDVCSLLDARDEADYVLSHGAEAGDQSIARGVLKAIEAIPTSAIPDPPSSCQGGDERRQHGTKSRSS